MPTSTSTTTSPDEAIPSIGTALRNCAGAAARLITLDEVNAKAAVLADNDNRVHLPDRPAKRLTRRCPAKTTWPAVVDDVESLNHRTLCRHGSQRRPDAADPPQPAAIVAEQELAGLGVTEITLANGVRVLLKPTDFKDDEVLFNAVSPGGSSLVQTSDFPEASTIDDVVNQSGVGDYSADGPGQGAHGQDRQRDALHPRADRRLRRQRLARRPGDALPA